MNAAAELLAELARRKIELKPHGDRLRYRPRAAVTQTWRTGSRFTRLIY